MNLRKLNDPELLSYTDKNVREERRITLTCLQCLREVELRRLFVELGYSSMYEMCIRHYKYSEGQTQRRLSAARLLKELPEIEERIQSGDLNITNLAKVQSFVRAEKQAQHNLSKSEKLELIESIENKSTRQVEKDLIKYSSQPEILMSQFGIASGDLKNHCKFEVWMNMEMQGLLTEFKNLYAHELIDGSPVSILKVLLEKALKEKKKKLGLFQKDNAVLPSAPKTEGVSSEMKDRRQLESELLGGKSKVKTLRETIPAETQRQVWHRAQARCEHQTEGSRCDSKHALQMDHVQPIALGGGCELQNLRLLCRNHNSRRSLKTFGQLNF